MLERPAVYTNRLQCVECGRISGENERGWTARLTVDEDERAEAKRIGGISRPRGYPAVLAPKDPTRATVAAAIVVSFEQPRLTTPRQLQRAHANDSESRSKGGRR